MFEDVMKGIRTAIGDALSVEGLKRAGAWLAEEAEKRLPGADGLNKKLWAKGLLLQVVEEYDNRLPVIGAFMDLPPIDAIEKAGVDWAVEWGYAQLQVVRNLGPAPVTDAEELPAGGVE